MKQKRFSVEQIVAVLKQAEAGVPLAELLRRVGVSEQTFYRWKKQYASFPLLPSTLRRPFPPGDSLAQKPSKPASVSR